MSEDYIQLPPDSLGKRVRALKRTIGNIDVYERVVAIAEPLSGNLLFSQYPTYSACVVASTVAANKHHLVIFNNSTSRVIILRVLISPETTATVTGFIMGYRLIRTTTAGAGGTAITVNKMDTSDPNLPSDITVWTNPTTAPTLGPVVAVASINPEEAGGGPSNVKIYEWMFWEKPLTLRQGEGITLQQYGTAGVGLLDACAIFMVI